jgi:hypothetical protein
MHWIIIGAEMTIGVFLVLTALCLLGVLAVFVSDFLEALDRRSSRKEREKWEREHEAAENARRERRLEEQREWKWLDDHRTDPRRDDPAWNDEYLKRWHRWVEQ